MKHRIVLSMAAAALLVVSAAGAQAQTGFGVRAGQIAISSDDDMITMDASTAFGAHVALGFLPIVDFMIGAEYLSGTADYDYGGVLQLENQDFKSIGVFADIRKTFGLLPMFPVKLVVGGGLDLNLMSYLDSEAVENYTGGDPDLADFTKQGTHLMAGLEIKLPILPFTVNAEYRMQTIKLDDGKINNNGITLLITFGF
ncbi:outer membrane beta-barrel protein [Gemmatimonadota bacterium]